MANTDVANLIKKSGIAVTGETYALISLTEGEWLKMLGNPQLSPRMAVPFMIFKDKFEITLLLDEIDFAAISAGLVNARVEKGFRLVTFEIELDFAVYGFLAEITRILAEAEIPLVALSSFSRDHLLIKQTDLAGALMVLREYVDEIC